jgi:hypothetical protein
MQLCEPSGTSLENKEFRVEDRDAATEEAADWVKAALDRSFPRPEPKLKVTVSVIVDKSAGHHKITVDPPDPLRQDRFWTFTDFGEKIGHPALHESKEAAEEAIVRALSDKANGPVRKILLHVDRPGYDIELISVRVGDPPVTKELHLLKEPAFTAIVDEIVGDDRGAEGLRAKLRAKGLRVGTREDLKAKEKKYEQSRKKDIGEGQRLLLLREARVDAFVRGSYEERAD